MNRNLEISLKSLSQSNFHLSYTFSIMMGWHQMVSRTKTNYRTYRTRSYCLNFCEHDHFLMIIISCRANNDIFLLIFYTNRTTTNAYNVAIFSCFLCLATVMVGFFLFALLNDILLLIHN